jgi:bla regulator protein BlaR1
MNSYLSSIGPALANHLWQSTAFTLVVWALTWALRNNRARVRHSLWLAASIKFLVPFALLISVGDHLLPHAKHPIAPVVYSAMEAVEQPFSDVALPQVVQVVHSPTLRERIAARAPEYLELFWLLGVATALLIWWNRWRTVVSILRRSAPASEGREVDLLRCIEASLVGCVPRRPLEFRLSTERMEPGIFGVFRPVLVWPEGLSGRLDDEQIEAILAHELTHVERRDNLSAALHMLVEAIFWFHPFVWWIDRKMVNERERACDEAVVELGGDAETYADSLLETCRFCMASPLPCVSGVTGADLKKRVMEIISPRALLNMTWTKKLLVASTTMCVLVATACVDGEPGGVASRRASTLSSQ